MRDLKEQYEDANLDQISEEILDHISKTIDSYSLGVEDVKKLAKWFENNHGFSVENSKYEEINDDFDGFLADNLSQPNGDLQYDLILEKGAKE